MEEGGTLSCPPSFGHIKAEPPYVIHIRRSHLYGILRLGQFMETESGTESSGDRGREGRVLSLHCLQRLRWVMEIVEISSRTLCSIQHMQTLPEKSTGK